MSYSSRVSASSSKSSKSRYYKELFYELVREYMSQTSLHGCRYLTEKGRHWFERLLWLVAQILATWGAIYTILNVYQEFINTPIVTTIESTKYPIWNVPFPAVAVCNINKIVKSKARELARNFSQPEFGLNMTEDELFKWVRYLGRIYDHEIQGYDDIVYFNQLLSTAYGNDSYDLSDILIKLTPTCESLLVRCMWQGKIRNCSDIFSFRKTMEGMCCVFNYVRDKDEFSSATEEPTEIIDGLRSTSAGYKTGLTVVVNPQIHEYYYPLISSYGTKVLVFNPHDFPDTPSGGLIEKLVPPNSEVFFSLSATSLYTVPEVKTIPASKRGCLFKTELAQLFSGYYSYSNCLMNCRIKSILTLCGCVPFYFPTLEKWQNLKPEENIPGMEFERSQSLECPDCLPACSDSSYNVQTSTASILFPIRFRNKLLEGINFTKEYSVFHLFFGSLDSTRLKQDILFHWYDMLSNFGGICSLFIGFSFISIIEVLYFFTIRGFYFLQSKKKKREKGARFREVVRLAVKQKQNSAAPRESIYWNEMAPRVRQNFYNSER